MSLRSASPWTRTSSPISSCSSMTCLISAFSASLYSASERVPSRWSARALRISVVCGKEPIVVIGSVGRPSSSRWTLLRSSNAGSRLTAPSGRAATRSTTAELWMVVDSARVRTARSDWANASPAPSSPATSAWISASFSSAKASHGATSTGMLRSAFRVCGTCCREVEVDTDTESAERPRDSSTSVRSRRLAVQTLRPSISPATRWVSEGIASRTRSG